MESCAEEEEEGKAATDPIMYTYRNLPSILNCTYIKGQNYGIFEMLRWNAIFKLPVGPRNYSFYSNAFFEKKETTTSDYNTLPKHFGSHFHLTRIAEPQHYLLITPNYCPGFETQYTQSRPFKVDSIYITMPVSFVSLHLITWALYQLTSSSSEGWVQYKIFWQRRDTDIILINVYC